MSYREGSLYEKTWSSSKNIFAKIMFNSLHSITNFKKLGHLGNLKNLYLRNETVLEITDYRLQFIYFDKSET